MTTDLQIIVCADGTVLWENPELKVRREQILSPQEVKVLSGESPYAEYRQYFSPTYQWPNEQESI